MSLPFPWAEWSAKQLGPGSWRFAMWTLGQCPDRLGGHANRPNEIAQLGRGTTEKRISAFFAGPVRSYAAALLRGRNGNLSPHLFGYICEGIDDDCLKGAVFAATIEGTTTEGLSISKPFKTTNKRLCGGGLSSAAAAKQRIALAVQRVFFPLVAGYGAAGGSRSRKVLFHAISGPGTAAYNDLPGRLSFPGWGIQDWTTKSQGTALNGTGRKKKKTDQQMRPDNFRGM